MANSGNFHCLDWASISIAVGAGAVGGLFCFLSTEMMVAIGISGFVGAVPNRWVWSGCLWNWGSNYRDCFFRELG